MHTIIVGAGRVGAGLASQLSEQGHEVTILRRHDGRIRVDSERLRRWERDRNRWVGKTTFLMELPLPIKGGE